MTLGETAGFALKLHGAIWLAGAAAYYKYGDRTDLFEKAARGNRNARQTLRDSIAGELGRQLSPVVRDAARTKTPLLNPNGSYIEQPADVTASEAFYQAIRDFVANSSGALVDYRQILRSTEQWRKWAGRLSHSILALVVLETSMLACVVLLELIGMTDDTREIIMLWSFAPTFVTALTVLVCLAAVHFNQTTISTLRERHDPEA
jgi:hypothetical protein